MGEAQSSQMFSNDSEVGMCSQGRVVSPSECNSPKSNQEYNVLILSTFIQIFRRKYSDMFVCVCARVSVHGCIFTGVLGHIPVGLPFWTCLTLAFDP